MEKQLYDVTIDLQDEYTSLVNRAVGQQLSSLLAQRLTALPEPGILFLDFSVVTSIHISFLDEFLAPALRDLKRGAFGDKYLVGINVDVKRIAIADLHQLMINNHMLFLFYDKKGAQLLLGAPDGPLPQALDYVQRTEKQTARQLALQMGFSEEASAKCLNQLADNRIVRRGATSEGVEYFDAILTSSAGARITKSSVSDELIERIDSVGAIERTAHYQLPSGAHVAEFLHLSRIFSDARFVAKAATVLGDMVKDLDVDTIVTTKTPNNLVVSQILGDYLDCRVVGTILDKVDTRMVSASGQMLRKEWNVLIFIDVVSTGWIANLLIDYVRRAHATIQGISTLVDTSAGSVSFAPYSFIKLAEIPLKLYPQASCPLCIDKVPWLAIDLIPRS